MENEIMERPDIDEQVSKLEEINSNIPEKATFNVMKERTGPFNMFRHKVTGEEMNEHLKKLQDEIAEQNRRDMLTFDEFQKVYDAISVLDSDYLNKLVESAEELNQLKEEVDVVQKDNYKLSESIKEVVKAQGIILDKFSSFDNVLLLEEKCRNQEKEIALLQEEKATLKRIEQSVKTKFVLIFSCLTIAKCTYQQGRQQ